MEIKDIVKEWLRFADMDLQTAEHLFNNMSKPPVEIICYHCQQSAEKHLKAVIVSYNVDPPKIHDLEKLLSICNELTGKDSTSINEACTTLSEYAVQPRYPLEMDINESDTRIAIKHATMIKEYISKQLCLDD